jgi:hypothetical protein
LDLALLERTGTAGEERQTRRVHST